MVIRGGSKMINRTLFAWVFVIMIPLIPVILLYLFFQNQNYFELKDPTLGIYALGPIAAYIGLVIIGWRIFRELEKSGRLESPYFQQLLGEWEMESKSIHASAGKGNFNIDDKGGELVITGSIRENGEEYAQWNSEIAYLRDRYLYIYYNMEQLKEEGPTNLKGMCRLCILNIPVKEMEGQWTIVGESYTAGEMRCRKKEKNRN
jgi:hypothetical protein